jgi:phosphatidylglycerophosphate synthase
VRTVRSASVVGLAAQAVLLAALLGTVGLGVAGALVGLAYGAVVVCLLERGLRRAGATAPGPADRVTLIRAVLVGGVAALVTDSFSQPGATGALTGLAAVALLLDGVDGRVARHTGTVSAVGARFDVEVDSVLVFLLSLYAAHRLGPWVVALGSLHYALLLARTALAWLRRPAPPRPWCKVVAVVQGVALVVVSTEAVPRGVSVLLLLAVGALLAESFGHEVWELWRTRRPEAAGGAVPADLGLVRG